MKKRNDSKREVLKINIPVHDCFEVNPYDGVAFEITSDIADSATEDGASKPHRHPFYEILFVKKSDGHHVLDYTSHENISDMVFLICPGQVHYWEGVTDIDGTMIYFNEDFLIDTTLSVNAVWELNLFREMGGLGVPLNAYEMRQMEELIGMMDKEHRAKGPEYAAIIRAYLNIFLIQLFRSFQRKNANNAPQQRYSTLYENFQKLVHKHVAQRQSVRYFADRLNVSMGCLNVQVKRQTGLTPGEFIKKVEIAEAKRLIVNTEMSMGDIAKAMGFTDGSYFCRMFKKELGISPMKFRQSCAHKNGVRFKKRSRTKFVSEHVSEGEAGEA
ncbi:MAG: helix-turn-helix domain-containing protein [Clostridiales Family XIII bacterium]|jgi:AraC-like DNA-binding protein|nr:helix-turn-helix domain-containing protein [Clostridiales Family XIII bacterium]